MSAASQPSTGTVCGSIYRSSPFCISTGLAPRLPDWFTERFPAEYHRKRLFDEPPADPLHAGPFEKRNGAPRVSTPERARPEVLSEVGVRQPLQEARELAETAYGLRADVLRELLQRCTSVKTVRLCLQFGRELSLPWAASWTPRNCPPAAPAPGCPARPRGCWCSSHEPDLPRYCASANPGRPTRFCGPHLCPQGRHRDQSVHP